MSVNFLNYSRHEDFSHFLRFSTNAKLILFLLDYTFQNYSRVCVCTCRHAFISVMVLYRFRAIPFAPGSCNPLCTSDFICSNFIPSITFIFVSHSRISCLFVLSSQWTTGNGGGQIFLLRQLCKCMCNVYVYVYVTGGAPPPPPPPPTKNNII
jgi:hypothetical protein